MGRPNWTTCSIARRIQAPVIEGIPRTNIRVTIGLVATSTTFNPSVFMCNNRISHIPCKECRYSPKGRTTESIISSRSTVHSFPFSCRCGLHFTIMKASYLLVIKTLTQFRSLWFSIQNLSSTGGAPDEICTFSLRYLILLRSFV
ncbi:hypothetical protein Hanom_Chr00s002565g01701681 [Helianthus anomalus]